MIIKKLVYVNNSNSYISSKMESGKIHREVIVKLLDD